MQLAAGVAREARVVRAALAAAVLKVVVEATAKTAHAIRAALGMAAAAAPAVEVVKVAKEVLADPGGTAGGVKISPSIARRISRDLLLLTRAEAAAESPAKPANLAFPDQTEGAENPAKSRQLTIVLHLVPLMVCPRSIRATSALGRGGHPEHRWALTISWIEAGSSLK